MARMKMQKVLPGAYAPLLGLEAYARTHNDKRTFELVKIRASALNGCGYCLAMHTRDARAAGESEDRITALQKQWRDTDLFSPAEEAALALTDEVTRLSADGVSDAVWDEAVNRWDLKGTGRLLMAIIAINCWNRLAITTGLEAEDL
ncbi:carboxymuconolactone decarboxylase family protein [Millisia brevis]|uniref:carboxymuconolactone decarboxylase family protein n=1 Tax=Millisia brevis TaxID=264148 RepID=UPI00082F3C33|nr:carboxymuconolactone decarboxylase family protein [Millisia brevis]